MGNFVNRTTLAYRKSGNDPHYPDPPWLAVIPGSNNATLLETVESKYLTLTGDVLSEMTQPEKDAVDAAEAAAQVAANRAEAVAATTTTDEPVGWEVRALIEMFNKRDNYLTNRIAELQTALLDIKATTGGTANIRDAIPASFLATNTRARSAAITDYTDVINNGDVDS